MVLVASKGDNKDGVDEAAVVDYQGNPPDKSKTGGWLAAGLILGSELSERIVVNGISMNLVTYLMGNLHIPAAKSATMVTNFMGTLNLLGLLGGFLADAKLGRYLTVAISASVAALVPLLSLLYKYKTGAILLTVATSIPSFRPPPCSDYGRLHHQCIVANGNQLALLYAALYTIALGGGGIKSNVSGFGSDQFDSSDPQEEKAMIFFFNRFYFAISLGSMFAVTVLVYIQTDVGRSWGYGISAATMVIAVVILLCGTRKYRFREARGSPLTIIWRVLFLAWKQRNKQYPSHPSLLNGFHDATVPHTQRFKCLDKAAILSDQNVGNKNNPWVVSTVTQVEEVKMVVKLIPIWSTCILFWTIYSQMTTFTIEQAEIMNRNVGSFAIPAGCYSAFLIVSILIFTSLNEKIFVPLARKITHNVQGLTSLQRIGIGLIYATLAIGAAAIVERERRGMYVRHTTKISAFWLVIQFFLVGAGEAFFYVGQLEFFIREAPEKMKSMSTGLFLSAVSMGFFFSSVLVAIVGKITGRAWLKSNLNKGRLDHFYWLLAGLGVLNYGIFVLFSMRHQYKVQHFIPGDSEVKELKNLNDEIGEQIEKKESYKGMEDP